jgi:hypothetical protein
LPIREVVQHSVQKVPERDNEVARKIIKFTSLYIYSIRWWPRGHRGLGFRAFSIMVTSYLMDEIPE